MNSERSLRQTLGVLSMMLLCSSALTTETKVSNSNRDSGLLLQIEGDAVSADIQAKSLGEVAQALEAATAVTIHFQAPELKQQSVTVKFEKRALDTALQAILKDMNYFMITDPTEQGVNIQAHVFSRLAGNNSIRDSVAGETDVSEQGSEAAADLGPQSPKDLPSPPELLDSDPTARSRELENNVALYGSKSLALVLSAASDSDAGVRAKSEELLLNEFNDVVPKETLSTIALTSESADNRLQALEALAEIEDQANYARMTLDSALRDPNPGVQQRAQDLLQELSD